MREYRYTVDLGKTPLKSHCFHRQLAWPVYAWKALVPTAYTEELNVLEKLFLSLAKIDKLKDTSLFFELGLSKDLVQSVNRSCIDHGYLDNECKITKMGDTILRNSTNLEHDMLMNFEHVYIFRDALTGDIVPNFHIKELPREEKKQYDYVLEENTHFRHPKPTFVEIGQAVKLRKQLNHIAETIQKDYANETVEAEQLSFLDEFDLMVDDVDWRLIDNDGEIETKTLADKEESKAEVGFGVKSNYKIIGMKPEILYLEADLYIDPDLPERIGVTSPFGQYEDDWFTKHVLMQLQKDTNLKETIDFFMEEAKEELKDRFPFNNHLDIELFKKYPIIANYESWKPVRIQIEATVRAYNRLVEGHEDYDTFYMRAQRTLEGILTYCINQIPNKTEVMNSVSKLGFIDSLKRISEEIRIDIPRNFHSRNFYDRLKQVARNRGISSKDRALFLAFDAYYTEGDNLSLAFLKNIPDFYRRINLIANIRNKAAHFNGENEDSHLFKDIKQELDFLIDSLIAHYFLSRG